MRGQQGRETETRWHKEQNIEETKSRMPDSLSDSLFRSLHATKLFQGCMEFLESTSKLHCGNVYLVLFCGIVFVGTMTAAAETWALLTTPVDKQTAWMKEQPLWGTRQGLSIVPLTSVLLCLWVQLCDVYLLSEWVSLDRKYSEKGWESFALTKKGKSENVDSIRFFMFSCPNKYTWVSVWTFT